MPLFKKILIANRGEIACRIIRTARKLNITCAVVYSDADREALHVKQADEAWHIGPSPASKSYLNIDAIISTAQKCGADAIHPGYGFLSENAVFAKKCEENHLTFIGPTAETIAAMGSKIAAKQLMEQYGIATIPGYHGEDQTLKTLQKAATKIGYPVLLKASAGGGGKGMRIVTQPASLAAAIDAVQREARASFGDDHVLLEKYLDSPRHIEIQIFSDLHGNTIHLFERECSIQRRHQKILEETPAPHYSPALRKKMTAAAIAAAQAIHYRGAGTIEFLVDKNEHFYFMETNTRLQVEHPITEMITGCDLVEWQIRIAAGETLPLTQSQLKARGHAVEVRIYAEDPTKDFLPSPGTLAQCYFPPETTQLRLECGVHAGDIISSYYDPLIAKLIAWGENREAAIDRLHHALSEVILTGITTNVSFLKNMLLHPVFRKGDINTHFIDIYGTALLQKKTGYTDPWHTLAGWRMNLPLQPILSSHTETTAVHMLEINNHLIAPLPSTVVAIFVSAGEHVEAGAELITVEAMKMEHTLRAPLKGRVKAIHCALGEFVTEGKLLMELTPELSSSRSSS